MRTICIGSKAKPCHMTAFIEYKVLFLRMKVNPPLQRDVVLKIFASACRIKNGCRQNLLDNYLREIFVHFLCLFNGYWSTATMMMELTKKNRQEIQKTTIRANQSVSLTSCHMTIAFPPR